MGKSRSELSSTRSGLGSVMDEAGRQLDARDCMQGGIAGLEFSIRIGEIDQRA